MSMPAVSWSSVEETEIQLNTLFEGTEGWIEIRCLREGERTEAKIQSPERGCGWVGRQAGRGGEACID